MRYKYIFCFVILISVINFTSNLCVPDQNCPTNSGVCRANICECLPGYKTLITDNNTTQVFCNYKQFSKWYPFLLELFFPSIGLFFIRRYLHGFIKLALFIPLIWGNKNVPLIFFLFFSIMYLIDLILIIFKIYKDGNGIPLV